MTITILPACVFGGKINWMINAIILMPVSAATFLTVIIVRFNPLLVGGIVFWVSGIACYFVNTTDQYLIGGIAMIFGYLVPGGYMLREQKNNHA